MGKANRIKSEKAQDVLATPMVKKKTKKPLPTWLGTTIVIVLLLALVLTAAFFVLNKAGTFKRMRVMMRSENFKVTVPMMSIMVTTEYQSTVSYYDNLIAGFGSSSNVNIPISGGKGGDNLDREKPLRDQIYARQNENGETLAEPETWLDHFIALAASDMKQTLALCEAAKANGIELGEAEMATIERQIDNHKAVALANIDYFATVDGYFAYMYGDSVTEKDVRALLELDALAAKYRKHHAHTLAEQIPGEDVTAEYENNNLGDKENKYDTYIDYIGYSFTATFTASTKTDEAEKKAENEKNAAKYEEKKAKYAKWVDELEKVAKEDPDNFEHKLRATLQEMFFEEEKDTLLAKKSGDAPTLTADEEQACRTAADTRTQSVMNSTAIRKNANTKDMADEDLKKWLADETDLRKSGDNFKIVKNTDAFGEKVESDTPETTDEDKKEETKEYKNSTSTFAVYLTTSGLHKNTGKTAAGGHILFAIDTFKDSITKGDLTSTASLSGELKVLADRVLAKSGKVTAELMAKELLAVMQEDGALTTKTVNGTTYYVMDQEKFEIYGAKYTDDSGVIYSDIHEGQMVAEFNDWIFSDKRIEGEVSYPDAVKTEYGYHIMLFCNKGDEAWEHEIRETLADADAKVKELTDALVLKKDNTTKKSYKDLIG